MSVGVVCRSQRSSYVLLMVFADTREKRIQKCATHASLRCRDEKDDGMAEVRGMVRRALRRTTSMRAAFKVRAQEISKAFFMIFIRYQRRVDL